MFLCEWCFTYFLLVILIIITSVVIYFKNAYTFWEKKNVPNLPPTIPFGNFKDYVLQRKSIGEQLLQIYNELRYTGKAYYGIYMLAQPSLMILDPDLLKNIMVQNFTSFVSRQRLDNEYDTLSENIITVSGPKWKFLRSQFSPTFTSAKMKYMFHNLAQTGEELKKVIKEITHKGEPLYVNDMMARFTTDIIATCGFGVDCNTLKYPDNEFREQGRKIFKLSRWEHIQNTALRFFPFLSKILHFKRLRKQSIEFFMNLVTSTIEYREKNNIRRKDFLDLLIQLKSQGFIDEDDTDSDNDIKEKSLDGKNLTVEQIAAQCFAFYIAGYDTSSITLAMAIYELSIHQELQEKARKEVRKVLDKYEGKITYDAIIDMTYLDQVIEETLRLHTPIPAVTRKCTIDFKLPDGNLEIKKGMTLFIPSNGLHKNPEYYPDPEVFDPDRFSPEEKEKRHPYAFLPFGAGPRNCIGLRFAMLQIKVGLSVLLNNHKFTLNAKTQTPLKINPLSSFYEIIGGIWANVEDAKE